MPRVVTLHFTLRDPEGRVLETTLGGRPVSYLEGGGDIIDGLEEAVRPLPAGGKARVLVPAAKAYGLRDPAQVRRMKRSDLPVEGEVRVGDTFQAGRDRHAPTVTIVAVEGEDVFLDANHPLAGMDLAFDVEIVAVREATAEERKAAGSAGADRVEGDSG